MNAVNPLITLPIAATFAMATATYAEGFKVTRLAPVVDPIGFAGAFAGIHRSHLLAGGGANFPDGVMPWNGGKKVWHDRLFSLDLNQAGAAWKPAGKLPARNGYGVSLSVEEGVVIIGGSDESHHLADVWLMTLDENLQASFRALPALHVPLAQMCGATLGRRIHLCGGVVKPDATEASTAHWALDLDALEKGWQSMPALPAAGRILATSAVVDDSFYIMAGCSLSTDPAGKPVRNYLRDAWKFSAGRWSRVADLPHPLVAAASPAPVSGRSIFLVSGDDGSQVNLVSRDDHNGFSKEVLRYDAGNDTWSSVGELNVPPPVTVAVAAWKNAFIFFNGEVKPGVRTPQVFSFSPL